MTTIHIPNAPKIPGLAFRTFAGESDFPKMVAVFEASREIDQFDWTYTLDDLQREFKHMEHCDPSQDLLVAEIGDEMIGYSRCWWDLLEEGLYLYQHIGLEKPAWRRMGIGRALVQASERRLREIAAAHPAEAPKSFDRGTVDTEIGLEILLQQEGYAPIRYGYMMSRPTADPLPEAPMPQGLEVRPVSMAEVRKVMAAVNEAFRDHWGYREMTENDLNAFLEWPHLKPELWKVAFDGDEVAGTVLNFVDPEENEQYGRKRGYTEEITTGRKWRKRGLATSLLVQSVQMFREMGFEETAHGVDSQNVSGALRLYERVGYKVRRRFTTYRKALD
jgi:ribosomal protein S18 acetylase RimI-like enzyme